MVRYLVGIDLGTTNSALGYIDLQTIPKSGVPEIHTFEITQLIAPAECGDRQLLPSFLYLPGGHDLPAGATALPWDPARTFAVGEFGRDHGSRIPGRLVSSAKSWLCHPGVDRSAPLLPWNAPADVSRISPVDASAKYLSHLIESWNYKMAGGQTGNSLEKQSVILTVPASFDDVARKLTVEAAQKAGLENFTLLEEPQAAFYCWLAKHSSTEINNLVPGSRCLVVDVGGGTTDFSLIEAVEQQGELGFIRLALGDHLLLGGDNMDLSLAKDVEGRLSKSARLDAAQFGALIQSCRLAKEKLLGPAPPASFTVNIVGRGRQVVGGAQHTGLSPTQVHQVLYNGFFPHVSMEETPARGSRSGLHEIGLPYVTDAAITRHLASFLKRQGNVPNPHSGGQNHKLAPDAILFNGGVFKPPALRERLLEVMRAWYEGPGLPWNPLVLTNPSLDLAVAWGAAYYAWLRHTGRRRIGGGLARSYYIAVGATQANQQLLAPNSAISLLCVVPQKLEEGQELSLEQPQLGLSLGQPVSFPLYTSTVRPSDGAGDILKLAPEQLLQLPPLHTVLRGGKRSALKQVTVTVASRVTEIGTLELWCVAKEGNNRWRLEFNVRETMQDNPASESSVQGLKKEASLAVENLWPEEQVKEAGRLIEDCFKATDYDLAPKVLPKALESVLEASRHEWPTGLCRRLWEFLTDVADQRRRSPQYLARWFYLVGFCLRPGFGDPADRFRVEQLWKLVNTPARPGSDPSTSASARVTTPRVVEGSADYWIMWRRVAGGLNRQLQYALWERLQSTFLPGKSRGSIKPGANELAEMWRAVASLELLDVKQKHLLGEMVLKSLRHRPVPTYAFWTLTRLGTRSLLYGPLNAVVHRETAERWIDAILPFKPTHETERTAWAFCLAQLTRCTGQRALDVDEDHRRQVITLLRSLPIPAMWSQMVEEVTVTEATEQNKMFGDSLPVGLRLIHAEESQIGVKRNV